MGSWGRWVLYVVTLPWTVTVGYGWAVLMCLLWAAEWESLKFQGTAVLTTQWRRWAAKRWGYSTTVGRAVIYHPDHGDDDVDIDTRVERHEHVHVRQVEDMMLLSLLVGIVVAALTDVWWHWLVVWWSGGAWQLPGFVTSALRGWHPYRDSEHERSAYAQTDFPLSLGQSWIEHREKRRAKKRLQEQQRG